MNQSTCFVYEVRNGGPEAKEIQYTYATVSRVGMFSPEELLGGPCSPAGLDDDTRSTVLLVRSYSLEVTALRNKAPGHD